MIRSLFLMHILNDEYEQVYIKRHPPARSREANTDVTKTVIQRLATRVNLIDSNVKRKHVYSLVQNIILIYIANFALYDNCDGVNFTTHPFKYIKP